MSIEMEVHTSTAHEVLRTYEPQVLVFDKPDEVDRHAAGMFIEQVLTLPTSVLTLPTGRTPEGMYRYIRNAQKRGLRLDEVNVFNLDEYWPLPKKHPASYASYMDRNLVGVPPDRRHIPNSEAPDPHLEAARYENELNRFPVNLAILGIGPGRTCHIGFNERGSDLNSRTRCVRLDPETVKANARDFPYLLHMPLNAITQGVGNILQAKAIILLAKGNNKAIGISEMLRGDIGPDSPASYLRMHPNVTVILDGEAASLL